MPYLSLNFDDYLERFIEPGPECGDFGVTQADRSHNQLLIAHARTRYRVGQSVLYDGKHLVQITAVQPKGFISRSASRSAFRHEPLLPIVANCDIYRFVALTKSGPPSGQTTEDYLSPGPLS